MKPLDPEFAEISGEDHCFGDETVWKTFEGRLIDDERPEELNYCDRCKLHKIRNANDAIAERLDSGIAFRVLDNVRRPTVMLIAVKLHNHPVTFASVIRSEPPTARWERSVGNGFGVKSFTQKAPKGSLIEKGRLWPVRHFPS